MQLSQLFQNLSPSFHFHCSVLRIIFEIGLKRSYYLDLYSWDLLAIFEDHGKVSKELSSFPDLKYFKDFFRYLLRIFLSSL